MLLTAKEYPVRNLPGEKVLVEIREGLKTDGLSLQLRCNHHQADKRSACQLDGWTGHAGGRST
ncbi:MAG: hypothetical protein KKE53_04460 [Proteobacteria bacterium]|nr:hypothetical protein [Pseudomonadota bacterium]